MAQGWRKPDLKAGAGMSRRLLRVHLFGPGDGVCDFASGEQAEETEIIDLYYWPTPNGHKITMFLEEAGVAYAIHPVDISAGDQFKRDFLAISPNNRMPAIIDTAPADLGEPISVFESGAILLYPAEKTGRFLPKDLRGRKTAMEWLFWQVGGLGPMARQNHHFGVYAPSRIPYAIERYVKETNRLYGVLDRHLESRTCHRRRRLQRRRHGCLSVDRSLEAPAAASGRVFEPAALVRHGARSPWNAVCLRERRAVLLFGQTANRAPAA
jgi:glutathione S-transferase